MLSLYLYLSGSFSAARGFGLAAAEVFSKAGVLENSCGLCIYHLHLVSLQVEKHDLIFKLQYKLRLSYPLVVFYRAQLLASR